MEMVSRRDNLTDVVIIGNSIPPKKIVIWKAYTDIIMSHNLFRLFIRLAEFKREDSNMSPELHTRATCISESRGEKTTWKGSSLGTSLCEPHEKIRWRPYQYGEHFNSDIFQQLFLEEVWYTRCDESWHFARNGS